VAEKLARVRLIKGDDITLRFTVVDEDGVAVNITGWAISWIMTSGLVKTVGAGVTITDAPNGVVEVEIDPVDTASLTEIHYCHKLRRTGTGTVSTLAYGNIQIIDPCG
jgi:hypothetical protein